MNMKRFHFSLSKKECNNNCNPVSDYPHWQCTDDGFQTFRIEVYAESEDKILQLWPNAYQIEELDCCIPPVPAEYAELKRQLNAIYDRMKEIRTQFANDMPFKIGDTIQCEEGIGFICQIYVREYDIHSIEIVFNPFKKDGSPSTRKRTHVLKLLPGLYGRRIKNVLINGQTLVNYAKNSI